MNRIAEDILMHVGVGHDDDPPGRGSGRYGFGTGDNPYQHATGFVARYEELKKQSPPLSEKEIAEKMKLQSTTQLRTRLKNANDQIWLSKSKRAHELREQGLTLDEVASRMGYNNDSSVRSLLNENTEERKKQVRTVADYIKKTVDEHGMMDVGKGTEKYLGYISKEKLTAALELLDEEGYPVYNHRVEQATNRGKFTTLKTVCPPGTEYKEVYKTVGEIHSFAEINDYILTEDGTSIKPAFQYPSSMDSKRLMIRYGDEGGSQKDGLVEIRRGVKDLSLGDANYSQVRILVDGTHYIKGMAVYSDGKDMPDGVDIIFNTNKKSGTPALGEKDTVLKRIKNDPENPFGSLIKEKGGQSNYIDDDGKEKLSLINKRGDEGDWNDWSDKLPSQFLSKQPQELVDRQLAISMIDKKAEYDEIISLTNPTVKKALLNAFATDCDAAAVHLQAASLPRQKYQVILPLTTIKDNEVYAPNYIDGEKVALIRYPHAGSFEIPILKVNNKNKEGRKVIGANPIDAVGINSNVANILSGADFDGDTVMVIPTNSKTKIKGRDPLDNGPLSKLKDFDPKMEYGKGSTTNENFKRMKNTQTEMGIISNLITDMQIKGAKDDEIARAVKYSMVVIDAEKHELDYQRCYKEQNIAQLKRDYQGRIEDGKFRTGASTIISRAKNEQDVPKRQGMPRINEDGSLSWKIADNLYYTNKKGKVVMRTQESTQMAETNDARTLSSGHPIEESYAIYANAMKSLANQSRKEAMAIKTEKVSASAKETYQAEVASLMGKLNNAEKNKPRERIAQARTTADVEKRYPKYKKLTKEEQEDKKKYSQQRLVANRLAVGAKRNPIEIEDREWEAIQSRAIPATTLEQIFNYTDMDKLKERATPRKSNGSLPDWKISQIRQMANNPNVKYSNSMIADRLGISVSTVNKYLKGSE